ncbi:hypothetical protein B0F90DRAFT_1816694 [Multifurca ochricompacta]|uniref:Uncharacterized protein n=1 Tax=Multifurca ochricompacta TaxID=376703 RepID=A0AAD4M660_9AGAM|nr:hypothetical protein B0F90DRAFT_1816694 [Multifurca ochricompacta]
MFILRRPRYLSQWATLSTYRSSTRRLLHDNGNNGHRQNRHAQFYSDLVPAMIPVALLGSAVYMGLQLLQTYLSHEKYLDEARARVEELEREIDALLLERRNTSSATNATVDATAPEGWLNWLRRG